MAVPVVDINQKEDSGLPEVIVLKFADSKIPIFRESKNLDYIKYGEDNLYPEYLTYLYDKSGKHGAIVNGKSFYIYGEGYENGDIIINANSDSLNDISKKAILDIEVYGGYKYEIIWGYNRRIAQIYHVDYKTIRKGKDGGFFFNECWGKNDRDRVFIPAFDPKNPVGSQIFEYNEYRPGTRLYPLPTYIASNNYIETDIEISKFWLSAIRNGMMPSKMLQFYMGDPGEDKKGELEKGFKRKFAGAENAGKFVMVFNPGGKEKSIDVQDLSQTDLDKLFVELNKTCQQEIFSGHSVTSPMLFGIKTEGQLGGNTELQTSYTIFQNTYSKPKATAYDKEINYLLSYSLFPGTYELRPTDPIGIQFDIKDVINAIPKAFVFEHLGIPKDMWEMPNIGEDNRPTPTIPIAPPTAPIGNARDMSMSNAILQNLTGRQRQGIDGILRKYDKGQLNADRAKTYLRQYAFTDGEINTLLGMNAVQMSAQDEDDIIIGMFDTCGDSKNDFEILKSKRVSFTSEFEMQEDEELWKDEAFKTYDVSVSEERILELIKKDKRITPEVIAGVIGESKAFVVGKISTLTKRGYLEERIETIGIDEIIERSIPESVNISMPPISGKSNPSQVSVKYSYEVKPGVGPVLIPTSRPFCIKMIGLNRLYSRAEIETISQRLGYSVFDRKGGWWGKNPECRHLWKSNLVVKK